MGIAHRIDIEERAWNTGCHLLRSFHVQLEAGSELENGTLLQARACSKDALHVHVPQNATPGGRPGCRQ